MTHETKELVRLLKHLTAELEAGRAYTMRVRHQTDTGDRYDGPQNLMHDPDPKDFKRIIKGDLKIIYAYEIPKAKTTKTPDEEVAAALAGTS